MTCTPPKLICPYCSHSGALKTKVTLRSQYGDAVFRTRICENCGKDIRTEEKIVNRKARYQGGKVDAKETLWTLYAALEKEGRVAVMSTLKALNGLGRKGRVKNG